MAQESILEQLVRELAPKKKKAAKKAKYVLDVNGNLMSQRPTTKKELKAAVIAVSLKNPTAKVTVYELAGELSVALPVSGAVLEGGE